MRPVLCALSLSLALLAGPARAQGEDARADTTDWRRYVPLEVGNEWQYRSRESLPPDGRLAYVLSGWRVEADTTVGGERYSVLRTCEFEEGAPVSCPGRLLVRYGDALLLV